MTNPAADASVSPLVMTRVFDVPPERVFDAWLNSADLGQWTGPHGVRAEAQILEPRVGGRYRIVMHTPDGMNPVVGGVYREITRPSRLIFTWAWEHENHETLVTLTFKKVGNKTEMTLRHEGFAAAERRDSHSNGWTGSFDKLAEFLAGKKA